MHFLSRGSKLSSLNPLVLYADAFPYATTRSEMCVAFDIDDTMCARTDSENVADHSNLTSDEVKKTWIYRIFSNLISA
jgi:hypothetical protein